VVAIFPAVGADKRWLSSRDSDMSSRDSDTRMICKCVIDFGTSCFDLNATFLE